MCSGLTDVRGAGLLVIDLRAQVRRSRRREATNRTRIIVVDATVEGKRLGVGLVADCVFAVSDLSGAALEPPPSIGSRWRAEYVVGVGREGGEFVIVLDLDRLIEMDRSLRVERADSRRLAEQRIGSHGRAVAWSVEHERSVASRTIS